MGLAHNATTLPPPPLLPPSQRRRALRPRHPSTGLQGQKDGGVPATTGNRGDRGGREEGKGKTRRWWNSEQGLPASGRGRKILQQQSGVDQRFGAILRRCALRGDPVQRQPGRVDGEIVFCIMSVSSVLLEARQSVGESESTHPDLLRQDYGWRDQATTTRPRLLARALARPCHGRGRHARCKQC